MYRLSIYASRNSVFRAHKAELCGDVHFVAERFQAFSNQDLVRAKSVDIGSIEQGDAKLTARCKTMVDTASFPGPYD